MKPKTTQDVPPITLRGIAAIVLCVLSSLAIVASLALWLPQIREIERYQGFHTARFTLVLTGTFFGILGAALAALLFLGARTSWPLAAALIVANLGVGLAVVRYAKWPRTREMLRAVHRSDESKVKQYAALGVDLNGRGRWGWTWDCEGETPLTTAVQNRDLHMVKTLLACGVNMEATDGWNQHPLEVAIIAGDPACVALLLDHGAKINYRSRSALDTAMKYLRLDLVDLLLARGADPALGDPVNIALHASAQQRTALGVDEADIQAAIRKLAKGGADLDREVVHNRTLLTEALVAGRQSDARLLVERGADVDHEDGHGDTPLIVAARMGDVDSARTLLAAGADPNKGGGIGKRTPLVAAIRRGQREVARLLLERGADIHLEQNSGETPVLAAVRFSALDGNPEMLQFVLDLGASAVRTDLVRDRPSPLAVAAGLGDLRSAEILLDAGAPPDELHGSSATPLLLAIKAGHLDMVKLLVARGADVNKEFPRRDVTPLSQARQFQRRDIEAYLREQGATR
jgi:ankyrin repeat protein